MVEPYQPKFPVLFEQWRRHDLAYHEDLGGYIRPWFYEGLGPEDEPPVWGYVEKNYLLRYDDFMAVRFDWASSGLWSIPFPGSKADNWNLGGLKAMGLSETARQLLKEWRDPLDDMRRLEDDDYFDYEASVARGLAAAGEVKRSLGEGAYLEFRPFREMAIVDGNPIELEVPEFIASFAR